MKDYNLVIRPDSKKLIAYQNALTSTDDEMTKLFRSHYIYVNLGMSDTTDGLPQLNYPLLTEDSRSRPIVFLDLRKFKSKNFKVDGMELDDYTIRSTDKDALVLFSKILLDFQPHDMNNITNHTIKTLSFFLYSKLENMFILNNIDKNTILVAIGGFIIRSLDESSSEEGTHFYLLKERLIIEDNEDINRTISDLKRFNNTTMGFVDYLKEVDVSGKLERLTVELLNDALLKSTFGDFNKRLISMSIEFPLAWITLIHIHTGNTMLKKTSLSGSLQNTKSVTKYQDIKVHIDRIISNPR